MKINRVKLRGFIGIKKGLGLDELELELSGTAGLIALDGANGHGKTTVLDNLQPYACLASRAGALSHHVFLRDSSRELDFQWQGSEYKTIIKIDSESSRSEGYIFRDGSQKSETNGKISEYKAYIEELFGSQNLFFNSVFCAQNADKISDMTTGQLKALFSEFLRLDKLIEHEGTAKQCVNILNAQFQHNESEIKRTQRAIEALGDPKRWITNAKRKLEDIEQNKKYAVLKFQDHEKDLERIRSFAAGIDVHRQRLTELQGRHKEMTENLAGDREQVDQSIENLNSRVATLKNELQANDEILSQEAEICAAVDEHAQLSERLEALGAEVRSSHAAYMDAAEKRRNIEWDLNKAQEERKTIEKDSELIVLSSRMEFCREKIKDLDLKDPACQSTTCSFITGALKASEELPDLETRFTKRQAEIAERGIRLEAEIEATEVALDVHKTDEDKKRKAWGQAMEQKTEINDRMVETRKLTALSSQLEVAEKLSTEIKSRIKDIGIEVEGILDEFAKRERFQLAEIEKLEASIAELEKQLENDPQADIDKLVEKIQFIKDQIADLDQAYADKKAELARHEKDLEARAAAEELLDGLNSKRRAILKEGSEWRYLQLACGKDGLRALEIDSVAPVMSGYANRLLHGAFGPHYSIKMITQDDRGREVLDIIALRDDGSQTLIENLSGGERVWSLKALRLAQTLIAKEKSGRDFLSVMADEEDGALDVENALAFVQLYREFMAAGNFEDCFYITHKPECVGLADHVIRFNGKGVTIR